MRLIKIVRPLSVAVGLFGLAACSAGDNLAPVNQEPLALPEMPSVVAAKAVVAERIDAPITSDHGTLANASQSGAVTYQFTVNPTTGGSFYLGMHMVSFPAYTICDMSVTDYGPDQWLNSCTKLTTPITITATEWVNSQGHPQIDFANALRFYKNWSNQLPAVYLLDANASWSTWGRIDYCSGIGLTDCVNEAAADTALATQRDTVTGYLFRLIRHFSGYNVWA
jgi:hypothetical protein